VVLPVGQGDQACGEVGDGRMLEPDELLEELIAHLQAKPLTGQRVLITAGPTFESIDPVRGITNHSSGKMGFALARAAREAGAEVTLVSGPNRLVKTVERVISEPLALDPSEEGSGSLVALNAQGEPVTGITLSPQTVTVRRTDLGTLPVRTIGVVLSPAPATLTVDSRVTPSTVRVVGPPALLAQLSSVTVPVTYRPGKARLTPTLKLPAGVQALDSVVVDLTVRTKQAP